MTLHNEGELVWYLRDGLPEFEGGSTLGPILENASMFALLQAEVFAAEHGYSVYPEEDVTAQLGPRQRNESGHVPDEEALARGADISRILRVVAAEDVADFIALVLYFGVQGEAWQSVAPKIGRLGALYVITESGQRLLDDMETERVKRGQPDRGYHPAIRLFLEVGKEQVDREQVTKSPKRWSRDFKDLRHERVLRMPAQAHALLRDACDTWEAAAKGTGAMEKRSRRGRPALRLLQCGQACAGARVA